MSERTERSEGPRAHASGRLSMMKVAVVSTGVIGASWTALFLAHGLDVVATDPAPDAEDRLREAAAAAWPVLEQVGLAAGASPDRLTFTSDVREAVTDADFVQENGPEREDLKRALFETLDTHTPPEAVIASSSSFMPPSLMQAACTRHPSRVLVGHPFNPPHLIPLVEVVGGEHTADRAIEHAMAFYRRVGKRPIHVRKELPGHIANRLQAALWREAYSLVERGAASVADIDTAIAHGPGLRWALLGPFLNKHLSGGAGGIAHDLEHLGPPTERIWETLGTPDMTPELVARIIAGVDEELTGRDLAAIVAERDRVLLQLLAAKENLP
jgi:carnitine 3-dehydrogenase